jgi:hypothetical protein
MQVASGTEFYGVHGVGPVAQVAPAPSPAFALLDVAGGAAPKWTSDLIQAGGFKGAISVGVTLSRSGTLKINRYIDAAGTVLLKTDTQTLTAATAAVLTVNDGLAFAAMAVEIANTDATGGHTAAISNYALLLNAA